MQFLIALVGLCLGGIRKMYYLLHHLNLHTLRFYLYEAPIGAGFAPEACPLGVIVPKGRQKAIKQLCPTIFRPPEAGSVFGGGAFQPRAYARGYRMSPARAGWIFFRSYSTHTRHLLVPGLPRWGSRKQGCSKNPIRACATKY